MQYTIDQAVRETRRRAERLRRRRERRQTRLLGGAVLTLICILGGYGYQLIPQHWTVLELLPYGSFLLPGEAGGYVLTGVIAFIIGIAVTMLCLHYRTTHPPGGKDADGPAPTQEVIPKQEIQSTEHNMSQLTQETAQTTQQSKEEELK